MPVPFIVKSAKGLSLESTKKASLFSKIMHLFMMRKAGMVWNRVGKHILGKNILDIGMGSGSIAYFFRKKGYGVTSLDVTHLSIYDDLKPVIYDGKEMPFKKQEFDTAVIIHVLHHCGDSLKVLEEAKRTTKRVVFIEDTYRNPLEWLLVAVGDSVTNFEFWWHKYRSVLEWRKVIASKGWKLVAFDEWSEFGVTSLYGRYALFVVE
jgi:ubiquinone/menaquinone biosynthesis C-methylase UbiE